MVHNNDFFKIYGWMVNLGLRGNTLIAYAAIYKCKEENVLVDLNYISKWCNCSKNGFKFIITKLRRLGLINDTLFSFNNPEDAKKFTIKHSHKGFVCDWCGKESFLLHSHHYPIPANKGGKNIVNICPNCHYTYHKVKKG